MDREERTIRDDIYTYTSGARERVSLKIPHVGG